MIRLRKRIRELEAILKFKEEEIEELHEQLETTLSKGECKSEIFCRSCQHFKQLYGGKMFCLKCDTAPCEHFEPLPSIDEEYICY